MAKPYIGTSGWSYKDWGKRFYPADLTSTQQLPFLAQTFNSVELNASFYRLPQSKTFSNWREKTPSNFRFAVKLSRFITHIKRLHEVEDSWKLFLEHSSAMGDKLAVVLVQLPPSFKATDETLADVEAFLSYAAADHKLALEFRHSTCFEQPMLDILAKYKVCLVSAESSRFPHSPTGFAPASFVYYRFHGPERLYASPYGEDALVPWAKEMKQFLKDGKDIFAYFDNDVQGYALEDARILQRLIN